MNNFCERCGIKKAWIARRIGITEATLSRQFQFSRLDPTIAKEIKDLFHETGKKLKAFKFSDNPIRDIEYLRDECGIKSAWLARRAGIDDGLFLNNIRYNGPANQKYRDGLIMDVSNIANAMCKFEVPDDALKAA